MTEQARNPVSSRRRALTYTLCPPTSLQCWHLELDLGELLGGLADLAQEGEPARVGVGFRRRCLEQSGRRRDFGIRLLCPKEFLRWISTYRHKRRPKILEKLSAAAAQGRTANRLRDAKALVDFVVSLKFKERRTGTIRKAEIQEGDQNPFSWSRGF